MVSVPLAPLAPVAPPPVSAVAASQTPAPKAPAPPASVPLVAPDQWLNEPVVEPEPAPVHARFLSQDEETEEDDIFNDDEPGAYFTSSGSSATSVAVAAAPVQQAVMRTVTESSPVVTESPVPSARPQFTEPIAPEPFFAEPSREYVPTPPASFLGLTVDKSPANPSSSLFSESAEEAQRDLDTPAFMRRLRF